MIVRNLTCAVMVTLAACGGGDGGSFDVTARCSLVGEPYDAFTSATGARCGSGEGAGYCNEGDLCRSEGVCELVSTPTQHGWCAVLEATYTAFTSADGVRCGSGEGSGYCYAGDRCVEPGVCVLVLKGLGGTVRADLIGSQYTASTSGNGVRCGSGEGSGYCKAGDRCLTPGTCEIVLSAWTP